MDDFSLYGERFATPVMTAALSHLNAVYENGMVELARGAARSGAVCFAGMGEDEELSEMIRTGAKTIRIIKPYADNGLVTDRIAFAQECGVLAVGMDIMLLTGGEIMSGWKALRCGQRAWRKSANLSVRPGFPLWLRAF